MSIYRRSGAALVRCLECGHELKLEWEAGDLPIVIPVHCGEVQMLQVTHNDGMTPFTEPCTAGCCPPGFVHPAARLELERRAGLHKRD